MKHYIKAVAVQGKAQGLIDDEHTTSGTTYSSEKIESDLGNLLQSNSYSTVEQDTGRTWIGGQKVYSRTFTYSFNRSTTANSTEIIHNNFPIPYNKALFIKGSFVPTTAVPLIGTSDFYIYEGALRMIQRYTTQQSLKYDVYVYIEYIK